MTAEPDFMNSDQFIDILDPAIFHDRVLIVGKKKFYVVAGTLALYSEPFRAMFYGNFEDAQKKEIVINEVEPEAFEEFLYILYDDGNNIFLNEKILISMINLAHRFLTPKILKVCKKFIGEKMETLDSIMLDLLETVYKFDIEDLKKSIVNHLKQDSIISKFDLDTLAEYANRFDIHDLKESLGVHASKDVNFKNCRKRLEFAQINNMPRMKVAIGERLTKLGRNDIDDNDIIDLMESAFEHHFDPLKELLRERIFHDVSHQRPHVNRFIRNNLEEIYLLPTELKDFILMSAVTA